MKINSFILGAAALMLATSCSNDEVVQVAENSQVIGFSTFVNKATRATDLGEDNLQSLDVYGVTTGGTNVSSVIFNGTTINKGTNTVGDGNVWAYAGEPQYWINGFNYTFAAVAPSAATGVTVNQSAATTANGGISTIDFVNNGQVDLLFNAQEVAAGTPAWGQVVPFELSHILSRVIFSFTNNVNTDFKVEVTGLKFTNAYTVGTYTPADNAWTVEGQTKGEFGFTPNEVVSADYNETEVTAPSYIIPVAQGEGEGFNVEFTVAIFIKDAESGEYNDAANQTYTLTATIPARTYELGYSYAFNTVLTWQNVIDPEQNPIQFTVESVAIWDGLDDDPETVDATKKEE